MRWRFLPVALLTVPQATSFLAACVSDDESTAPSFDGGPSLDGSIDGGPSIDAPSTTTDGAPSDAAQDQGIEEGGPSNAIVQIAAGRYHACARRASGAVTCWGHNLFGALGNGTKSGDNDRNLAQVVTGLSDAVDISAGEHRSCAVRAGGEVVCWGDAGSIANGGTGEKLVPTPIVSSVDAGTPFGGAIEIAAKEFGHSCARRVAGTVTCWTPLNSSGRNGDGTTDGRNVPGSDVIGVTDAVELKKGLDFACARRATGAISCWGLNVNGMLGTGTAGGVTATPVAVLGIADATAIGGGGTHTCAVLANKTVQCWGVGLAGQVGNGVKQISNPTPTTVPGISDAKQVVGGETHTCALRETGAVMCWGSNSFGQLGDGTTTERLAPVAVSGLTDAVEIEAGYLFTCARRATGAVVCWGANDRSQLGDGTNTEHHVPHEVPGL